MVGLGFSPLRGFETRLVCDVLFFSCVGLLLLLFTSSFFCFFFFFSSFFFVLFFPSFFRFA